MTTSQDDSTARGSDAPTPSVLAAPVQLGLRAAVEVAIIGALFILYNVGRTISAGEESLARAHARTVHTLEAWLWLPSEAGMQHAAASVPHLFALANQYYSAVHFPLMIAFLVWGFFLRPRAEYLWARNLAIVLTLLALVIHIAYPLAPPRMFPEWGFTDTMTTIGPSPYEEAGALANQYAAMPSLHIGWALIIAVVAWRTAPRALALVAVVHLAITIGVVTITANHWILDGVVAAVLLGVALVIVPGPDPERRHVWHGWAGHHRSPAS